MPSHARREAVRIRRSGTVTAVASHERWHTQPDSGHTMELHWSLMLPKPAKAFDGCLAL